MITPSRKTPMSWNAGISLLHKPLSGHIYVERCPDIVILANAEMVQTPTRKAYRIEYDRDIFGVLLGWELEKEWL
jgi:hypothetical protein